MPGQIYFVSHPHPAEWKTHQKETFFFILGFQCYDGEKRPRRRINNLVGNFCVHLKINPNKIVHVNCDCLCQKNAFSFPGVNGNATWCQWAWRQHKIHVYHAIKNGAFTISLARWGCRSNLERVNFTSISRIDIFLILKKMSSSACHKT